MSGVFVVHFVVLLMQVFRNKLPRSTAHLESSLCQAAGHKNNFEIHKVGGRGGWEGGQRLCCNLLFLPFYLTILKPLSLGEGCKNTESRIPRFSKPFSQNKLIKHQPDNNSPALTLDTPDKLSHNLHPQCKRFHIPLL